MATYVSEEFPQWLASGTWAWTTPVPTMTTTEEKVKENVASKVRAQKLNEMKLIHAEKRHNAIKSNRTLTFL
jgi:hypothetical protein